MKQIFTMQLLGGARARALCRQLGAVSGHTLVALVLGSCTGTPTAPEYGAYPYGYYCPVSDVTLAANERNIRFFGHAYVRFPQSVLQTGEATTSWFGASITDCSTVDVACLKVNGANDAGSFYLIVPRLLEAKREYTLHGARAVTGFATAPHIEAIQVTLWQPPNSAVPPMKFTVEKSRGVVYWSGISFWAAGRTESGETCILQSPKGLFNQVDVQLPQILEAVPD